MTPGQAIGDHWQLLASLAGIGGMLFVFGKNLKSTLSGEIHSGVVLALNNGAGDRVREMVRLGVTEALMAHQVQCPVRDQVDRMEERLNRGGA